MKKKTIKIPIYGQTLLVYVGNPQEAAQKIHSEHQLNLIDETMSAGAWTALLVAPGWCQTVMALPEDVDLSTIVHECVHAAYILLDHIGIELTPMNHEPLAYLTDYLFEEVAKKVA